MAADSRENPFIAPPQRWLRVFLVFFVVAALVTATVAVTGSTRPVEASVSDEKLEALRQAIEEQERMRQELEQQIQQTEQQLAQYRAEENELLRQLAEIENELQRTVNERRRLDQQLQEIGHRLALTEAELDRAEEHLAERTELMNVRLVSTYKRGTVTYLEVLLDANDFADFLSRLDMLRKVVQQDVEIFREVEAARDEVVERKAQIVAQQEEREAVRAQLVAKEGDIRVQVAARAAMADEAQQNRQAVEAMLRAKEQASQEVERMIQDLQVQFARASGELAFTWPCNGQLTSPYGSRWHPIFGGFRMHSGIDIAGWPACSWGDPVRASESGVVIFAGVWGTLTSGYGITVVIDHGQNLSSLYAHNSSLAVRGGQLVDRGQVIAYVGSTGSSTGPHVHFEIRERGVPVNPMNYLP